MSWSILYVIDAVLILLFLISYYRKCYRRGYRIDFWYSSLFLTCVLPNMVMLPFAKSDLNIFVLGSALSSVVYVLPIVFLITLLGYFSMLLGGALWRLQVGLGLRNEVAELLNIIPRCSMILMSSPRILLFQSALCFLGQFSILAVYFSSAGIGFDLRRYTFENPTLRPIALIISNYSIIIASHCLARYVDTKERILLACTIGLTFGLVFFGARSSLVSIYLSVLICYFVSLRTNVSLTKIVSLMAIVLLFMFYLGNVRSGDYSPTGFLASIIGLIFYGNNFSDLRDFAWVYSLWDHVFWAGRTYLAAILSFVPRFASEFRDTWAIGVKTASTIGFDPQIHPGLRPGAFGESFFNFGLAGVVVIGLILGVITRRVDAQVKQALASPTPSMMAAFASTMLLTVSAALAVSASFSGLYILAGVYVFTWLCVGIERFFIPRPITADRPDGATG